MNPNDPFDDDDAFDWIDWLMLSFAVAVMTYLIYHLFKGPIHNFIQSLL